MLNVIISNHKKIQEVKREVQIDKVSFDILNKKIDLEVSVHHFNGEDEPISHIISAKKYILTAQNRLVWLDEFSGSTGEFYVEVPYQVPFEYEETNYFYVDGQGNVVDDTIFIDFSGLTLSSETITLIGYKTEYSGYTETRVTQIPHSICDYVEPEMIGLSPYQAKEYDFYFKLYNVNPFSNLENIFEFLVPYIVDRADRLGNFD